jgi:peptide/nickel transport system substrate-binding protein
MSRAAALGISTGLAMAMANKALADTPKRGGSLRIGLGHGSTSDSLDPGTWTNNFTALACGGSLSNSLTQIDVKANAVPDLCEDFDASDNVKTWAFKLRKGLTFHNGKTVTPEDVVASFRHHMGENTKSAVKTLLTSVVDIKADGPTTVRFTLSHGNADFPYLVSDVHFAIMPANEGGGVNWESGVRTGPFILERYDPGVTMTLKRNPNYHVADRPYFDEVKILTIADVTARTNAIITGEVDFIDRVDLKTLDRLKRNSNLSILEVAGYGHYVFSMNVTAPPFDNVDVRLALKYAVDRKEVAKKIFFDHATLGNDDPIARSIKYAIDPQPQFTYDPEKAKFHLQKAGLSSLKVDLSAADAAFAGCLDTAVLYREHAAKAGIEINVVREPNDGYWDNVWMKKPWTASYWSGRPTCDWMFSTGYAADSAANETFWKNPRFNHLLMAARSEAEDSKRAGMYAEMQQLVHDDGGVIALVFNNYVSAHTRKLAHGDVASFWDLDGLKLTERWWFA